MQSAKAVFMTIFSIRHIYGPFATVNENAYRSSFRSNLLAYNHIQIESYTVKVH